VKIGLYNLEPKLKNLALEKIRIYHQGQGDIVLECSPLEAHNGFDKIYASSIFDWTDKRYISPDMITGGTGFDLITVLPPEIESIEPHLNFGYTTRGCFRNCKFCVVRRKEGELRATGYIKNLYNPSLGRLVTLLDNNPLGLLEHFATNCNQARELNVMLDWNQGLDHRCLTPNIIDLIQSVKHKELRFAFDHPSYINSVEKAINLLQRKGVNRCNWYVLVGFDTTFKDDLFRLNYLRERGQNAYVQRYRSKTKKLGVEYTALAEWANQHHIFHGMTWLQFTNHPKNKTRKQYLQSISS